MQTRGITKGTAGLIAGVAVGALGLTLGGIAIANATTPTAVPTVVVTTDAPTPTITPTAPAPEVIVTTPAPGPALTTAAPVATPTTAAPAPTKAAAPKAPTVPKAATSTPVPGQLPPPGYTGPLVNGVVPGTDATPIPANCGYSDINGNWITQPCG